MYHLVSQEEEKAVACVNEASVEHYYSWKEKGSFLDSGNMDTISQSTYGAYDPLLKSNHLVFYKESKKENVSHKSGEKEKVSLVGRVIEGAAVVAAVATGTSSSRGRNVDFQNEIMREADTSRVGMLTERSQEVSEVSSPITDQEHQFLEELAHLIEVSRTVTGLRALDFINLTEEAGLLGGYNRGVNMNESTLILNDNNIPLTIPGEEGVVSIVPTIIPTGVKVSGRETTSKRIPTAVENQAVRKRIKEALEAYCGREKRQEFLPSFYDLENDEKPVTIQDMIPFFSLYELKREDVVAVKSLARSYEVPHVALQKSLEHSAKN